MSLLLLFNGSLPAGPSLPADVRPYGRGSTTLQIVAGAILAIQDNGTITQVSLTGVRSVTDPGGTTGTGGASGGSTGGLD